MGWFVIIHSTTFISFVGNDAQLISSNMIYNDVQLILINMILCSWCYLFCDPYVRHSINRNICTIYKALDICTLNNYFVVWIQVEIQPLPPLSTSRHLMFAGVSWRWAFPLNSRADRVLRFLALCMHRIAYDLTVRCTPPSSVTQSKCRHRQDAAFIYPIPALHTKTGRYPACKWSVTSCYIFSKHYLRVELTGLVECSFILVELKYGTKGLGRQSANLNYSIIL